MPGRLRHRLLSASLSVAVLSGCDDIDADDTGVGETSSDAPQSASLVVANAWELVEGAEDPFDDLRTGDEFCLPGAARVEDDGVELSTGLCSFQTLRQASRVEVGPGDTVGLTFYHFNLVSPEPAEGYAAIQVGESRIWEYATPIPADANYLDLSLPVEVEASAGTPVYLHVHNHGANTWKLVRLERLEP